jgi:Protein of unknown function (DUF1569)
MTLLNTFDPKTTEETFKRLEKLNYISKPQWGKMNVAQMLAHLNVTYDLTYGKTVRHYSFFSKLMMKMFVKGIVTSDKSYPKNSRTGPDFIISNERDFEKEKSIFIDYVKQTEAKGVAYFEGKENPAFGVLTAKEWSAQFYKHIDHHFAQFGV